MSNSGPITLISQQQQRLEALLQLLDLESQALQERNTRQIESLLKQKLTLLEQIAHCDKELEIQCQESDLKQDEEAISGINLCQALLKQCKEKNQHNSQVAEQSLASLGRLQQVLNATRNPNSLTYNQEGNTSTGGSLGRVIKA